MNSYHLTAFLFWCIFTLEDMKIDAARGVASGMVIIFITAVIYIAKTTKTDL